MVSLSLLEINSRLEQWRRQIAPAVAQLSVGELTASVNQLRLWLDAVDGLGRASGFNLCDSALAAAWKEYKEHLQAVREVLPQIEIRLQAERELLRSQQQHLQDADAWVDASRLTG
jgi:hypothetical protein